jgi:hypothetical protein
VPSYAQPRDELGSEHLELVRPDARGDLHEEDAALERDRVGAVRDARADDDLPFAHRDRRSALGEAIFAGAIEEILERLGGVEVLATPPLGRPGHRREW